MKEKNAPDLLVCNFIEKFAVKDKIIDYQNKRKQFFNLHLLFGKRHQR